MMCSLCLGTLYRVLFYLHASTTYGKLEYIIRKEVSVVEVDEAAVAKDAAARLFGPEDDNEADMV